MREAERTPDTGNVTGAPSPSRSSGYAYLEYYVDVGTRKRYRSILVHRGACNVRISGFTLVIVVVALPTAFPVSSSEHNANRIGIAGCVGWIVVNVLMREAERTT